MPDLHAICLRCGSPKGAYDGVCPSCGHCPEGMGLQVAWLLSREHWPQEALLAAQARIRAGEPVAPSERLLEKARRALLATTATDPGLSGARLAAVIAGNALLTPFLGLVLWGSWRTTRPRAARQALLTALPWVLVDLAVGLWLR